jgi:hypothetical protein
MKAFLKNPNVRLVLKQKTVNDRLKEFLKYYKIFGVKFLNATY